MLLGCVQPAYLAWIPFFERMQMADVFVYLDDVEYSKNSFHNRNRIKTASGDLLLTVPVLYKGYSKELICNIPINNKVAWSVKHWKSIEMNYSKAPYFKDIAGDLYKIYSSHWRSLGELNITLLELFKSFLGIKTPTFVSSLLDLEGSSNEKLINMCKKLNADAFIVKPGTEHYHPRANFHDNGIKFECFSWEPKPYKQLYGEFIPGLSILDFAMNCGPNSL